MKKLSFFVVMFFIAIGTRCYATTSISISNTSECAISVSIYGHDPLNSCAGIHTNWASIAAYTGSLSFSELMDANDATNCGISYSGPGWQGPYCVNTTSHTGWDAIVIDVIGVGAYTISGNACIITGPTSATDCMGNTIYFASSGWGTSSVTISVHN